jgi:putative transposase
MNYHIPLFPGNAYHIFSHAVGNEQLFRCREHYAIFLERYFKYTIPVVETFTWSLIPNHFHFLIRVLPEEKIIQHYIKKKGHSPDEDILPDFIMEQFSNWLNSYAKTYNLRYNRRGALFVDYLKRVEIADDKQFAATLLYINNNSRHHGLCKKITDWEWSGYHELVNKKPTLLLREEIMDWFGGIDAFRLMHL